MSRIAAAIVALLIATGGAAHAAPVAAEPPLVAPADEETTPPAIVARIDLSDQTMTVYVAERLAYTFKVSTARRGYITPVGRYQALWLSPKHRSRKYDNAPMPWAVFFHGGYAVHGTTEIRRLGKPASHGCVRLHPDNARTFFSLVKDAGIEATLITVVN